MKGHYKEVELCEQAIEDYYRYGTAVNEDRAIPSSIDGLKPVARRALWSTFEKGATHKAPYSKSAAFVGDVMAKYHPHGDKSIYDTYVTLVNSPVPMIDGKGNWGSLFDKAVAAQRYTNLRMSKYAEMIFFDPFYTPVIQKVENYDRCNKEPLVLPALLPNLLVNGNFGIGVGVKSEIPCYTIESIIRVLRRVLSENRLCKSKDCLKLQFRTMYNAEPVFDMQEVKTFYKTGKGKVSYKSTYTVEKNEIRIHTFSSINIDTAFSKCLNFDGVVRVNNESETKDKPLLVVYTKKNLDGKQMKVLADTLMEKVFTSTDNYIVNVVDRIADAYNEGSGKLKASTIPNVINDWIKFRLDLEQRACQYWIDKAQKEIDYRLLLIKAVDNLEIIIEALRKKFTKDELKEFIAKKMKISLEQSDVIINLKVYQLRKLEKEQLQQEIKERKETIAGYKVRIQKPAEYVKTHVNEIGKKLKDLTSK